MSLAIYDAIGDWYAWAQMPKNDNGVFFAFTGCTRSALEKCIEILRANRGAWLGADSVTANAAFSMIASETAANTGADMDGVIKFCNWVLTATRGDSDIYNYFAGGDFSRLDYWSKLISDTVTGKAERAAEIIQYGVEYESPAQKTILDRVLAAGYILGACYIVKKVLD